MTFYEQTVRMLAEDVLTHLTDNNNNPADLDRYELLLVVSDVVDTMTADVYDVVRELIGEGDER